MDIPNNGTNLVVNGMLSPDSTFKVHVSGSLHILDNGRPPNIGDATVIVTDGNGTAETLTHTTDGWYVGAGNPVVGQTYNITATSPIYNGISGSTTIPQVVPITSWDTTHNVSFGDLQTVEVKVKFTDPSNVKNYYYLKVETEYFNGVDYYRGNIGFYSREGIANQSNSEDYYWRGVTFNDELINGQTYDFTLYLDDWIFDDNGQGQGNTRIILSLYSASEDYYEYIRTYAAYEETNGDPFAQPVIVYSNIEGGHGIFGGYAIASDSIGL